MTQNENYSKNWIKIEHNLFSYFKEPLSNNEMKVKLGVGIKYTVFNYLCYKIASSKHGYLIKYQFFRGISSLRFCIEVKSNPFYPSNDY